jgi:hypothetical protein
VELADRFFRHSGQAGDSEREPESNKFRDFEIPVFAGMTLEVFRLFRRDRVIEVEKSLGILWHVECIIRQNYILSLRGATRLRD